MDILRLYRGNMERTFYTKIKGNKSKGTQRAIHCIEPEHITLNQKVDVTEGKENKREHKKQTNSKRKIVS